MIWTYPSPTGSMIVSGWSMLAWVSIQWKFSAKAFLEFVRRRNVEILLNKNAVIYALIAACGLLWSNWCEYKQHLGVEFGEYSLRQYRYAKEYYRYAAERM